MLTRLKGQRFLQVAAEYEHTAAVISGGKLLAWGYNGQCQCDVPGRSEGLRFL